jgi:hypothetical protein
MVQSVIEEARLAWNSRTHGQSSFDAVFCEGSSYKNLEVLKQFLTKTILPNVCSTCKISTWEEKPIKLHLDHIDGNPRNHSITNLRLLCPNCHSQTETYCRGDTSKKKKLLTRVTIPSDEFIRILSITPNIRQALISLGIRASGDNYTRAYELAKEAGIDIGTSPITLKRPPQEELLQKMIHYQCTNTLSTIYGVSRSTVQRWLKEYKIPTSRDDAGYLALREGQEPRPGLPSRETLLATIREEGSVSLGATKLGISIKRLRKILAHIPEEWKSLKHELSMRAHTRKVIRPSHEELEFLLLNKVSFLSLGKKYGVSDNAVRKWVKGYGIKY